MVLEAEKAAMAKYEKVVVEAKKNNYPLPKSKDYTENK
jgi:hypothetical protein